MTENTAVLPSTYRGSVDELFWGLLWSLGFLIVALWLGSYIGSIYKELGVSSYSEFSDLRWSIKADYWALDIVPSAHIAMFICYGVASLLTIASLHGFVYEAREVSTFSKNEEGHWGKVSTISYGFPFSKYEYQIVFDRIITITIDQGTIGRILNTGTLRVRMVTFINADSKESVWSFKAINAPHKRKDELEAALIGHEGLQVKIVPEPEQSPGHQS